MRKRTILCVSLFTAIGAVSSAGWVAAQPPGAQRGPDSPRPAVRGTEGEQGRPPGNPLADALDVNHDHVIDANEIKSAAAALLKLDRNGNGQLEEDELRPQPPGPRDSGPRDGGPRDGGPRDAGPREAGPRDGGPRDGDRPEANRDRGPQGQPDARQDSPRDFGPPPGGPGGPGGGPPDPARFVEHAMQFDANGDGLLSREELMTFARQMANHQPGGPRDGGGGPRDGGGGPRDGGGGPRDGGGGPRDGGGGPRDGTGEPRGGERDAAPTRPRRPSLED